MIKIKINRIITLLVTTIFAVMFFGCADKTPTNSSYKSDSASWQQFKSKQAVDNIDK